MNTALNADQHLLGAFSIINNIYSDMRANKGILFFKQNTSIIPYFYLGRPEAEGCGLDIGLLFVHQQQRLVVCQTEVLPCRHVSESERLTPANVTAAPPGHVQSETLAHEKKEKNNKAKE